MANTISLRDVSGDDLPIFFEQQADPVANLMAAFPARSREAFFVHWTTKILADSTGVKKTIVFDGRVAGNILSWEQDGKRLVGYWLGKEFWGKGIASAALAEFLKLITIRPLHAFVATHNVASVRVLEKCGFVISSRSTVFSIVHGRDVDELELVLEK